MAHEEDEAMKLEAEEIRSHLPVSRIFNLQEIINKFDVFRFISQVDYKTVVVSAYPHSIEWIDKWMERGKRCRERPEVISLLHSKWPTFEYVSPFAFTLPTSFSADVEQEVILILSSSATLSNYYYFYAAAAVENS